eukprot:scaffold23475_cov94-Isochrysis_galbana.AAC.2
MAGRRAKGVLKGAAGQVKEAVEALLAAGGVARRQRAGPAVAQGLGRAQGGELQVEPRHMAGRVTLGTGSEPEGLLGSRPVEA